MHREQFEWPKLDILELSDDIILTSGDGSCSADSRNSGDCNPDTGKSVDTCNTDDGCSSDACDTDDTCNSDSCGNDTCGNDTCGSYECDSDNASCSCDGADSSCDTHCIGDCGTTCDTEEEPPCGEDSSSP